MTGDATDHGFLAVPGKSYLERFQRLAGMLPHRIYREGGEEKVKFPLGLLLDRETIAGTERIRQVIEKFTGSSEGVTYNGLFHEPAINIPVRIIRQLNEAATQALVEALAPVIHLSSYAFRYRHSLAEIMGIVDESRIRRFQYTDKENRPVTYEFAFPQKWTVGEIVRPSVAREFNNALGERLFSSAFIGRDYVIVLINESDMERLLTNPNRGQLVDILAARLSGAGNSRNPRISIAARISQRLLPHRGT